MLDLGAMSPQRRRRLGAALVAGLISLGGAPASAQNSPAADPAVAAAVAPLQAAIDRVRALQAGLPAPRSDVEVLRRLAQLDQAPRDALSQIDFKALSEPQKRAVWAAVAAVMAPVDKANQATLLAMLPPEGWFTIARYGREASTDAFLIVQHGDPALWRRFLPVLERLARRREVDGGAYALMYDRLQWSEHRPQRYGSQMICQGGRYVPAPTEDPGRIDARRRAVGLPPYADYLKRFETDTC